MHRKHLLLAALAGLLTTSVLVAAEVKGSQVAGRVGKVMKSIDWQESLAAAQEKARKEKKLVFWLQLVGELDGGL
ncbi:MAG: hypothetical protein HY721_20750 [Planctomycetes bacterium]|nr:hypothetical protein [Planctomycetota bacterium]